jgi:tetratricopeptide (TPR) repeat protein
MTSSPTSLLVAAVLAITGPAGPAPAAPPDPAAALEQGDLSSAREGADAAVQEKATPATLGEQARVLEAAGDLEGAIAALERALALLPEGPSAERAAVTERIDSLQARARGAVADEPASTHRAELDSARAEREAAGKLEARPRPEPAPPPDRIVNKWYFWVTLAAIVAAAGAITGISIRAAAQEQDDALGRGPAPLPPPGGLVLRF